MDDIQRLERSPNEGNLKECPACQLKPSMCFFCRIKAKRHYATVETQYAKPQSSSSSPSKGARDALHNRMTVSAWR